MKKLFFLLMLPAAVQAAPYIELGISHNFEAHEYRCIKGNKYGQCSKTPLGSVELGYEQPFLYGKVSGFLKHQSSLQETDHGMNEVGASYRYTFGK